MSLKPLACDCIICFDEMFIKSNLHYLNNRNKIVGFHNTGIKINFKPVTDVFVLMARQIRFNWKQLLEYFFVNNTFVEEELKTII